MNRLPDLPDGIRTLTNPELARLERAYPDLPRKPADCVTCQGTGTFRWWNRYTSDFDPLDPRVIEYECNCVDQWVAHLYLLNNGVRHAYQTLSWFDMTATDPKALGMCRQYLDRADRFVRAGMGLVLHGNMGNGKTGLSTLVAKGLMARGFDVYFTTFSEMLDMVQASWRDQDERSWFIRRIRNAKVLVIDDIGKEHRITRPVQSGQLAEGESGLRTMARPVAESTLDEVLRHRVGSRRPTIVTTNFDFKQLGIDYGLSAMSLLSECSLDFHFTGEDFRQRMGERRFNEIEFDLTAPVVVER